MVNLSIQVAKGLQRDCKSPNVSPGVINPKDVLGLAAKIRSQYETWYTGGL